MRLNVRAISRRNVIAAALGAVLAGGPLIAFDCWLEGTINRQATSEVDSIARRAVALAESRLGEAAEKLVELGATGLSCDAGDVSAMRRAVFESVAIKEIAILDGDGKALCSDSELPSGERKLIYSEPWPRNNLVFDVFRYAGGKAAVRLRRNLGEGNREIAALIPVALLLPYIAIQGSQVRGYVKLTTADGTIIGDAGDQSLEGDGNIIVAAGSKKFGFDAEIVAPRSLLPIEYLDLTWIGGIVTEGVILTLLCIAMMRKRRQPDNPVAKMERALEAGEFVPYYQPIVDIRSGQLRGAEVLVRWRKPDGTVELPGSFIPLAESSGLILDMTRDLMRRVCAEAGPAIGCRPALKIAFNFAGQLFAKPSIVKEVRNIFANSPIKLGQVVLELTERDQVENFTETRQVIAALQGLGVRIAIDDVGTGHNGLSYMLKLGIDIIKIDKIFVDAIGTDRNSTTIVETLVDLAHNMRMDIVAEGVENFQQVMYLRDMGIRSAQGYVFAPPLPGSAFLQLIDALDPVKTAAVPMPVRGRAA
jgi:sensor c-di-GMP phosphodiesterase-like protein